MTQAEKLLKSKSKPKSSMLNSVSITVDQRNAILESIRTFDDPTEFPIDDARRAIGYTWSVIARLEQDIANCGDSKLLGSLYSSLVRATKTLVDQMLSHQKIQESKAKQEYISITTHAAILKALQDIFILSLRKRGFTESQIVDLVEEMSHLQKEYPIVELDMPTLKKRLFGEDPTASLPAPDEIPVDQKYNRINQLSKPIKRQSKRD